MTKAARYIGANSCCMIGLPPLMIKVATAIQNTTGIAKILVIRPKITNALQNNSANMVSCNEILRDT